MSLLKVLKLFKMVKLAFIDVIAAYISTFMLRDHFSHESRCNIIKISALKDEYVFRDKCF